MNLSSGRRKPRIINWLHLCLSVCLLVSISEAGQAQQAAGRKREFLEMFARAYRAVEVSTNAIERTSLLTLSALPRNIPASGYCIPTRRANGVPLPHHPEDWRRWHGGGLRG